jgi:hypothetical protein
MTINEAIHQAVKEGYHVDNTEGIETDYNAANAEWSVWTRKDNESSFMIRVEETFLAPSFWQALGRSLGWREKDFVHHCFLCAGNDDGPGDFCGAEWRYHFHEFIDHLAGGGNPQSFFANLFCPRLDKLKI